MISPVILSQLLFDLFVDRSGLSELGVDPRSAAPHVVWMCFVCATALFCLSYGLPSVIQGNTMSHAVMRDVTQSRQRGMWYKEQRAHYGAK